MAELNKVVVVYDLDKTLCSKKQKNESYADVKPLHDNINVLNHLHDIGVEIIIDSARNMLTQNNDESKVIKNVGLDTLNWLKDNSVKYDGITFGKTMANCYVDDKALRPKELIKIYNSLIDKYDINEFKRAIDKYLEEN
jgi:capsule biosynthesis phosphatase